MKQRRISWVEYFMNIAKATALRSTCPKASVGAIVVKDNTILGAGYNGAPKGFPHCLDVGCVEINGHCVMAVHAEANAILHSHGNLQGATIFCTHMPCIECSKLIINSGISTVVFNVLYHDNRCETLGIESQAELFKRADIRCFQFV